MSRIPYLRRDELGPDGQQLWDGIVEGRGDAVVTAEGGLAGPFNAFVTAPGAGRRLSSLGAQLRFGTSIERRLSEIAIITTGARWQAEFEWWAHAPMAREHGVAAAVVDAIGRGEDPPFEADDERAVYVVARQLGQSGRLDQETYDAAHRFLGDAGMVELVSLCGYYTLISFVLNAFAVPLPPDAAPMWEGLPGGSGYSQDVDWNLFGCFRRGHVTYAPDEPELRVRLMAPTAGGTAWRCLRCGAFVTDGQHSSGPAAAAPLIRRGKELRGELILRVFAVERFFRFLVIGAAAYGVWRFRSDQAGIERAYNSDLPAIRALYRDLGFDVNHSRLLGLIQHSFTLTPRTLTFLAAGLAVYALIELVEGVGLWLGKRWGEYFAMVATSIFLPYEVYDLTVKITWLRVGALAVNLLLVIYLIWTKRLLGVRGGKAAYEARLRGESVLEVEQAALAAASPGQPGQSG